MYAQKFPDALNPEFGSVKAFHKSFGEMQVYELDFPVHRQFSKDRNQESRNIPGIIDVGISDLNIGISSARISLMDVYLDHFTQMFAHLLFFGRG